MDALSLYFFFVPTLTTIIAGLFVLELLNEFLAKRHRLGHLWWAIGIACYGLGNLLQSLIGLLGWQEFLFKAWYIFGALFGPAPLAVGMLHKIGQRTIAHISGLVVVLMVTTTGIFAVLSPIDHSVVNQYSLTGRPFEWQFVRQLTPFLNVSATIVLCVSALLSAVRYWHLPNGRLRSLGNGIIGFTILVAAAGGTMNRIGYTDPFYGIQLAGIILLWIGYRVGKKSLFHVPINQNSLQTVPSRV